MSKIKHYESPRRFPTTTYSDDSLFYYSYEMSCAIDQVRFSCDTTSKEAKSLILQAMALFGLDAFNASAMVIQCKRLKEMD